MKRFTPEEKYKYNIRKQEKNLRILLIMNLNGLII